MVMPSCSVVRRTSRAGTSRISGADLVGLLCGSGLAGADCPDRLVSDDNLLNAPQQQRSARAILICIADNFHGDVLLALGQRLAYAQDRGAGRSRERPGPSCCTASSVSLKYWRRSEWPMITYCNAQLLEHVSGDLAGESAGLLEVHVLSADCDLGALGSLYSSLNIRERYAENHLAPLGLGQQRLHLLDQSLGLCRSLVHLPVTGDNGLTSICDSCWFYPFHDGIADGSLCPSYKSPV